MLRRLVVALLFLYCAAEVNISTAQISSLRSRVPADTNTVMIIDAEKLFGSAASEKGRWEARRQAAFDAGLTFLSADTTGVVIAANIDLEFGKTIWQLTQTKHSQGMELSKVAALFDGQMDEVQGRAATRLPNDAFIVQVTKDQFASYTPANRQDVSRWLAATDSSGVDSLSPYIRQAFKYVEEAGTPIIVAFDLQGVLSGQEIKQRLEGSELAKTMADQLPEIVRVLSSVRGAMLGVTVSEKPFASIRIDFDQDAKPLEAIGKDLLVRVLERQGAMLDDIRGWNTEAKGNTLRMSGSLSESGLRRILSVLELPSTLASAMDQARASGSSSDSETLTRLASQQYYKSIQSLLKDLRHENDDKRTVTPGSVALWYDKYARKIDNLPILNVDDDLLAYGSDVSELLRSAEMSLKGVGMRSSVRQGVNQPNGDGYNSYYNNGYGDGYNNYSGYGGYRSGYSSYADPYAAAREKGRTDSIIRSQERTLGAASVQQVWQTIEAATADIRKVMTKKYEVEF